MVTTAQRVATRVLTAGDIEVHNVEFSSGQEPSNPSDFASLVMVEFTVKGRTLAKILRKQARVLGRFLEKAPKRLLLNAIGGSDEVLRAVSGPIRREVYNYIRDEFDETPPRVKVEFADESDWSYTAKADPRSESVRVEMEFDAIDA